MTHAAAGLFSHSGLDVLEPRLLMAADFNESEPNNTRRTADRINLDQGDAIVMGTVAGRAEKDFFRLKAPSTGTLFLDVSGAVRVAVLGPGGVKLDTVRGNQGDGMISFDALNNRNYWFRVRTNVNNGASYTMTLSEDVQGDGPGLPSRASEQEPNDGRSNANRFRLGDDDRAVLTGDADNRRDRDFFTFVADESTALDLDLDASLAGTSPLVSVHRSDGTRITATLPELDLNTLTFNVEEGERYFIKVKGRSGASTGYTVTLTEVVL